MSSTVFRRPGLQHRWGYVVDSLERIIPIYEVASSRIALFGDAEMRRSAVRFAVREASLVLDLGSGPGTMAKAVVAEKGFPVLLDVSRKMLQTCPDLERVQAVFEHLPFRDRSFDAVVAGFSLRDARDLASSLGQVRSIMKKGARFGCCDLGKPDSTTNALAIALYLRIVVPLIGLLAGGRAGLAFGSLYETYLLTLRNSQLVTLLKQFFDEVRLDARQGGASIVVCCKA